MGPFGHEGVVGQQRIQKPVCLGVVDVGAPDGPLRRSEEQGLPPVILADKSWDQPGKS